MKTVLTIGTLALLGFVQPASAQNMCGPGQQGYASATGTGAMMCGGMNSAADDPMAEKPAQQTQHSGMCPCCRNMAMMKGGMRGGQSHDTMPGMDSPK